tara:strand:+ start:123 stop:287 length:165 start_codon:yes stop_codon:yes gene_type:complete
LRIITLFATIASPPQAKGILPEKLVFSWNINDLIGLKFSCNIFSGGYSIKDLFL